MENERWKKDIAYAMTPFKLVTWPIGVWPLQVYNIYSLLRCALGTCCACLIVILPSMELYMGCTDVEGNTIGLTIICCGILGVLKTTWFRIYANSLINNYDSAINDYKTIDNIKERDIMRKHAFVGRILCCSMLGCCYLGCAIYAIIPFLDYEQDNRLNITNKDIRVQYTIPSRCTLEYLNFPTNMYKISCLIETFITILAATANLGNDALFINITLHVCGQINILRMHFFNFDATSPRIYDRFNALIQRHCYLIMLARELADLISFVLLIELFLISLLLCIMGFQLIFALKINDIVMIGKSLVILSIFLFQLTLYSFIGNYLKSEMEEIGPSVYQSTWYSFPRKLARNVIFILMQSKSPVTLQAGNFIVVNLSTYVSILRTSFSYSHYLDSMASERWKDDIAYAMTPFKLLTWPIGVWPLQVYNVYSLIRCILATCCMSMIVILPTMELHMGCTNAEQNIDSVMLIFCGILGVLKTICFRIYAKNLTNNYASARNDYLTIKNAEHRAIMRIHAFMGRMLSCSMVCFSYFSVTTYSLFPFLGDYEDNQMNTTDEDVVLEYPMPSRCALKYFSVPESLHKIICLFEFIVLILTCTCNLGNDSMFLNIILHVCGQVKILKANFIDFDVSNSQVYDHFNVLIQRNSYLIKMAKELVDVISFVLLMQLFLSSILLCIMGFQFILALKMNDIVKMGKSLIVLGTFLTQITVYSFVGDYLKSQMEEIGLFVYQSTWYDLPAKLTKNLIFVIMRAQSPVKLQAGNFIAVNLATYMSILKTSISYLSVLRVMVET
ncbi:uncharacterized protein [Anoplolepis gracilipes]|uniref:uncharacterized protein n=1 Tax=Anoplolepis gracilipes TaxID=354296 RepID=UPI003B9E8AC0